MTSGSVVVLGTGLMGSEIALDMLAERSVSSLRVVDSSESRLNELERQARARHPQVAVVTKLSSQVLNIQHDRAKLRKVLAEADVAIGALPHAIADKAVESAIDSGTSYVDLIFSWRAGEFSSIDKRAKDAGIILVPACGLAPGLTNILAMRGRDLLGGADDVRIMVGGIPERPIPPFNYRIVFSFDSVLEEYTRDALVVRDGKRVLLPALSELEEVTFDQLPGRKFEAFVTDGLSTLPLTIKARSMVEKTVRWPGHAELIKLLASTGLLSTKPITVPGLHDAVTPRSIVASLLTQELRMGQSDRDMTLLKVTVSYRGKTEEFSMVDRYDTKNHVTSMARTTAYPCTTVALILLERRPNPSGFTPPENLVRKRLFGYFLKRLKEREITIDERRLMTGNSSTISGQKGS
ncbi:MAG: saccharopine dehydrogenase NADP-binding domain-containing protein [Nitrososphaerota archaeon]|jgi:lysine 6-dehydrogenase|nr:saccharopine dehydrogenase NADP-binding domain-containing protein [Nitrososphaerota archaeon]